MNRDLQSIDEWSKAWLITFNALKTESMLITRKINPTDHPPLVFQEHRLVNVSSHKHLGLTFKNDLTWSQHVNSIVAKGNTLINIMKGLQYSLDRRTLETIYLSFVRPVLEYGSVVWDGCTQAEKDKIEKIQTAAARVVTGAMKGTSSLKLHEETGWQSLAECRQNAKLILMYKIVHNNAPSYLIDYIPQFPPTASNYSTRNRPSLYSFCARTSLFDKSFFPSTIRLWNQLSNDVRNSPNVNLFKAKLRTVIKCPVRHNVLYNHGPRYWAIRHARLRMGCSGLNSHLFKIGVVASPLCQCCKAEEDEFHFFFICPRYTPIRLKLQNTVAELAPLTISTLLFGCENCSIDDNLLIFTAVQEFIKDSKRL